MRGIIFSSPIFSFKFLFYLNFTIFHLLGRRGGEKTLSCRSLCFGQKKIPLLSFKSMMKVSKAGEEKKSIFSCFSLEHFFLPVWWKWMPRKKGRLIDEDEEAFLIGHLFNQLNTLRIKLYACASICVIYIHPDLCVRAHMNINAQIYTKLRNGGSQFWYSDVGFWAETG